MVTKEFLTTLLDYIEAVIDDRIAMNKTDGSWDFVDTGKSTKLKDRLIELAAGFERWHDGERGVRGEWRVASE